MKIEKDEFESVLKNQIDNVFAYAVMTTDGTIITKYGEKYFIDTTPIAAQKVLSCIADINSAKP